jgi:hypothetical protein
MLNLYQDVFRSFQSHKVKYVVIGGIAAISHGVPRTTLDLDILIEATEANAARLLSALTAVGFGTATLTTPQRVATTEITILNDWLRIDVQTKTPGLSFSTAWKNRRRHKQGDVIVNLASRNDLIRSKRAVGRPKDLEDVRLLTLQKRSPSKRPRNRPS